MGNETQARVGIDDLLKKQGWRLDDSGGKRNALPEKCVTLHGAGGMGKMPIAAKISTIWEE